MISLQRSMHSSQMYTPGPAMSFLTCFWLFPQNEHLSRSPPSPNLATANPRSDHSLSVPRCPRVVLLSFSVRACGGGDRGQLATRDDLVDDAVVLGLLAAHDEV